MNLLYSILFAGVNATQTIVPQTYYIANLSETDGSKCGEYISVTPMPVQVPVQTITPLVITTLDLQGNNSQE
jgi:hypothetical protein